MRRILLRWLFNVAGLYVATQLVPGLHVVGNWETFVVAAALFGILNAVVRPVLSFITCPLQILTLGLFTFVLNAVMLWLTAWLGAQFGIGFRLDDFWAAFFGALVISLVSFVLSLVVREQR